MRTRMLASVAAVVLFAPRIAHACPAHAHPLDAATLLTWWTLEPWVLGPVVLLALLYARGVRAVWRDAGVGHGVRTWEVAAYAGALASLVLALVSPLDRLSDILFAAHMSQHEILMVVSAPLVVLGRPWVAFAHALPVSVRTRAAGFVRHDSLRSAWRIATAPLVVLLVHGFVRWIWHVPALFEAALADERVHAVQHGLFFGTAALFWYALLRGRYGRAGYGIAVMYVFATATHSGVLGAWLAVARAPWYATHASRSASWGFDALADQQLAGLIMWVPASLVFALAGLALFAAWLGESEQRALRIERHDAPAPRASTP